MQSRSNVIGHTLQRKVVMIVVTGLTVTFSIFGYLSLEAVRRSTDVVFQERLMMAQITAAHIDLELKQALDYLQTVPGGWGDDLHDISSQPRRQTLADLSRHLPFLAQQSYVVDRDGTVVMAAPEPSPLEGADVSDYAYIRRVLESGRPEISGVVLDPVTRKPEVSLAVPIKDQAGVTVGVLATSTDIALANLSGLILGLTPGATGHTQILDANGTIMASTDTDQVLRRSHHYDLLFSLMRQKSATVISHAIEGEADSGREIVAFAPLSQTDWGVSVEQSEGEALAVGNELAARLLGLGLLSLLGAMVTCVLVLRNVVIPIETLTRASERIASGDLEGPVSTGGEDEVGRLGRAFEVMRIRLRQSREELDRWHAELELRVQQRTKELSGLFELSKSIAVSTDLDELIQAVVHKVAEVLDSTEAVYLYLDDPGHNGPLLRAWHGDPPEDLADQYLALASVAFETRLPIHHTGDDSHLESGAAVSAPTHGHRDRSRPGLGVRQSLSCVPLLTQNHSLGALLVRGRSSSEESTATNLPLMQALADQAAVAIQRALLAREAEQAVALREADKLKSMFISTITHELQSPLGFIKGYATTLLRPDAIFDGKTRREFLQIISDESDSLSALIDDLLDVSRLEAGALPMERRPASISGLLRRAAKRVRTRSDAHQIVMHVPDRLPMTDVDPRRIEQVARNLLDNAIKYSPKGGMVTIAAGVRDGSVIVSIADEGIGIPTSEQSRVFERFYRSSTASTVSRRGAGLGLAICRGIVEAHGGEIWIDSEPSQGTTVHFSLPVLGKMARRTTADGTAGVAAEAREIERMVAG